MKVIKTANYKKQLALKLLEWHGGQGSDLYSVGSSWLAQHDVPNENILGAIDELEDIARNRVPYPQVGEEFEENFKEIRQLQQALKDEMLKGDLFDNTDDIIGLEFKIDRNTVADKVFESQETLNKTTKSIHID